MDTATAKHLTTFETHYAASLRPYSGALPTPEQRPRLSLTMRDGGWAGHLLCLPGGVVVATLWRHEATRYSAYSPIPDNRPATRIPVGYHMARALLVGGARAGLLRPTELLAWKGYQQGGLGWLTHAFPKADPFLCWCAGQFVSQGGSAHYNSFHVRGNLDGAGVDLASLLVSWHAEVGDRLEALFHDTYWDADPTDPDDTVAG